MVVTALSLSGAAVMTLAGGLVSAYIAAAVKAKVALIEEDKMGGDCLNKILGTIHTYPTMSEAKRRQPEHGRKPMPRRNCSSWWRSSTHGEGVKD